MGGISPKKIALGLPSYGRHKTSQGMVLTYSELQERYGPITSDRDEAGGYLFNGQTTAAKKTKIALELGLGGVMVWEVGQDTRDETSLLAAISTVKREHAMIEQ